MSKGNAKTKAITAFCRACHTRIRFDERPELFDIVSCPECGREFEVIGVSPVQLDWHTNLVDDDDDDASSGRDHYYDLYDEWGGRTHQLFASRS